MLIGLCGAHRTGKTTLAREYAERSNMRFVPTNASEVFKILGHKPNEEYPLEVVLDIQEALLEVFKDIWEEAWMSEDDCITDRTPIDLIAYTMAHVKQNNITEELEERLINYVMDCYEVGNRLFNLYVVLLPGIDVVEADGKASLSYAYIDYISKLVLGTVVDESVYVPNYKIPAWCLDLEERMERIDAMISHTVDTYKKELKDTVKH